jgi:hypothetical protein
MCVFHLEGIGCLDDPSASEEWQMRPVSRQRASFKGETKKKQTSAQLGKRNQKKPPPPLKKKRLTMRLHRLL